MTVLVLVFAEVLPKTLAITRSDDVARFLSGPTEIVIWLFGPVVFRLWPASWVIVACGLALALAGLWGARRAPAA